MSTQLQTADSTAVDLIDQDNPDSIWAQIKFPSATKPYKFTPQQLKQALTEYSNNIQAIDTVLEDHKITVNTFFMLLGLFPEINETYLAAQRLKARKYGEAALKLWDSLPNNPVFYQADRDGNQVLTAAAVRYLEVKSTQYHRFAQIHETGTFVPVSKAETTNRNLSLQVNLNGKLPADFDLSNCDPTALVSVLKGKR